MKDWDVALSYSQYHGSWCPGDTGSQGISCYGIGLVSALAGLKWNLQNHNSSIIPWHLPCLIDSAMIHRARQSYNTAVLLVKFQKNPSVERSHHGQWKFCELWILDGLAQSWSAISPIVMHGRYCIIIATISPIAMHGRYPSFNPDPLLYKQYKQCLNGMDINAAHGCHCWCMYLYVCNYDANNLWIIKLTQNIWWQLVFVLMNDDSDT